MSKTIELARHLERLHINNMYKSDFYWTWDKTDEELEAIFTVADALRDLRERNQSTRIFDSGLGISIFRDNSTRTSGTSPEPASPRRRNHIPGSARSRRTCAPCARSSAKACRRISGRAMVIMAIQPTKASPTTAPRAVQAHTLAMARPPRKWPHQLRAVRYRSSPNRL